MDFKITIDNINNNKPLVSIITVCFNSENTIQDTIQSVIEQSYPNIEYIIIDGGSTDSTIEIVKKYEEHISKFVCESDEGIYDAMNKGVSMANGELIGILNSDDWYAINSVELVVKCYLDSHKQEEIFFGDLITCNYLKEEVYFTYGNRIRTKYAISHPTMFVKKTVYDKYGHYDCNYKLIADYDFMCRTIPFANCKYIPSVISYMREGGASSGNQIIRAKEYYGVMRKNGFSLFKTIVFSVKIPLKFYGRKLLEKLKLNFIANYIRKRIYKQYIDFK